MSNEEEFLNWLDEQKGYYIDDKEVEENFPDVEFNMIGITKKSHPLTGERQTPKPDLKEGVKRAMVNDFE